MTLTFLGAARTVTGSKHLLDLDGHRILVDCGMFQGLKALRERNWQPFPVAAKSITAVVLTHAHLDHCGLLPRLVGQGFTGRIFCTPATADLTRIVLADAAKIQEEDAERANRKGYTKHHPALPLFTVSEANRAMLQLQPVGYDRPVPIAPPAGIGVWPRGDRVDGKDRALRRRSWTLRPSRASRSDFRRRRRRAARRVHLRRSHARKG
jgi:metallo-beta-lactamase family protein